MTYSFLQCHVNDANRILATSAANGWTVHTINRAPGSTIVDILFERPEDLS